MIIKRKQFFKIQTAHGNSLAVQWLGLCAFTVVGPGSIPGQGTKTQGVFLAALHKLHGAAKKKKKKKFKQPKSVKNLSSPHSKIPVPPNLLTSVSFQWYS